MTRIYIGNRLLGKFTCDGRRMTRFQAFVYKIGVYTKRTVITSAVIVTAGWIATGSYYYAKVSVKPVTVWAESVKEVPIGIRFEEIPMLVKICKAESGSRQFLPNGNVVRGKVNPSDIGYCQINEYINNDEARKLGYDIFTEQGNKDYAVWLYMHRGTAPWSSSAGTWSR